MNWMPHKRKEGAIQHCNRHHSARPDYQLLGPFHFAINYLLPVTQCYAQRTVQEVPLH